MAAAEGRGGAIPPQNCGPARARARERRVGPLASAKVAGLRYVGDEATQGIRRLGKPGRFRYVNAGGRAVRYHGRWREVRDEVKYSRLAAFAQALALIRKRTRAHLKKPGLTRERVLAAVVQLLEKTLIRVGNEEYARDNRSYGLTTLRDQHAKVAGARVNFEFRGKSGIPSVRSSTRPR